MTIRKKQQRIAVCVVVVVGTIMGIAAALYGAEAIEWCSEILRVLWALFITL